MSRIVLLDAGPIGLLTNPKRSPENDACARWLQTLANANVQIVVPEITDYEVRRELLRANKTKGLRRLDELIDLVEYLPLTTPMMRQAASFWAQARQQRLTSVTYHDSSHRRFGRVSLLNNVHHDSFSGYSKLVQSVSQVKSATAIALQGLLSRGNYQQLYLLLFIFFASPCVILRLSSRNSLAYPYGDPFHRFPPGEHL